MMEPFFTTMAAAAAVKMGSSKKLPKLGFCL